MENGMPGTKIIPPLCMERRDSLSYGRLGYQLVLNELKADILLGSRSLLNEENIGNHQKERPKYPRRY